MNAPLQLKNIYLIVLVRQFKQTISMKTSLNHKHSICRPKTEAIKNLIEVTSSRITP